MPKERTVKVHLTHHAEPMEALGQNGLNQNGYGEEEEKMRRREEREKKKIGGTSHEGFRIEVYTMKELSVQGVPMFRLGARVDVSGRLLAGVSKGASKHPELRKQASALLKNPHPLALHPNLGLVGFKDVFDFIMTGAVSFEIVVRTFPKCRKKQRVYGLPPRPRCGWEAQGGPGTTKGPKGGPGMPWGAKGT